jgi:inner membrane protease ATP23
LESIKEIFLFFPTLEGFTMSEEKEFEKVTKFLTTQQKTHNRCEKWKLKLSQSSPILKFLLTELSKHSESPLLLCTSCDPKRAGGFAPGLGIVLCENNFLSKAHMEDTLAHELIHAYDNVTTKINWKNKLHVACTEIRAANLSGECAFTKEFKRGNWGIAKQHQECVRRRAVMSVLLSKIVNTEKEAEDAVRLVWKSCFQDTAPFDEIY